MCTENVRETQVYDKTTLRENAVFLTFEAENGPLTLFAGGSNYLNNLMLPRCVHCLGICARILLAQCRKVEVEK